MASSETTPSLGMTAPDFSLMGTDGRSHALADIVGPAGFVIAFICNHCPYVVAAAPRMVQDAATLRTEGFGFAAICSNDASKYPADSYPRMQEFSDQYAFDFPYLHDETQDVAKAFGASRTPEFFGFNRDGRLAYHGRLDEGGTGTPAVDAPRELVEAMREVARTGTGPRTQFPAVGCTIKWK